MNYYTLTIKLDKITDVYKLCSLTKRIESDIQINKHGFKKVVDGKSMLGIFSLGASELLDITVINPSEEDLQKFNDYMRIFIAQ